MSKKFYSIHGKPVERLFPYILRFRRHILANYFRGLLFFFLYGSISSTCWGYRVTNYQGTIGVHNVHLSIQILNGTGDSLKANGSYYYDKYLSPIPVYGVLDPNGLLSLCETHSKKEYWDIFHGKSAAFTNPKACPFQLNVGEKQVQGTWKGKGRTYKVQLEKIGEMDKHGIKGILEIPYWGQTQNHMFLGIYMEKEGIVNVTLQAVDKRSKVFTPVEQPDNSQEGCTFGFYSPAIYMNVDMYNLTSSGEDKVSLQCWCDKICSQNVYRLDKATDTYHLTSEEGATIATR